MLFRRALGALALVGAFLAAALPPASGQAPEGSLALELVRQPIWHEPGDDLNIGLRIENRSEQEIEGYIVTVSAHGRVTSRTELHASFDSPGFEASLITAEDRPDEVITAGGSVKVFLDQPVSALQSLAVTGDSGIYPLTISVFDGGGILLGTTRTPLVYYVEPPEIPLNLVPVLPLNVAATRGPGGVFRLSPDGGRPALEDALSPRGWLTRLLGAVEAASGPQPAPEPPGPRPRKGRRGPATKPRPAPDPVHLALATTPRVVEELADMADGYPVAGDDGVQQVRPSAPAAQAARAALDRLQSLLVTKGVQPLLSPYSGPDLPSLVRAGLEDHIAAQITEGQAVLEEVLGLEADRGWIFPPAGRVDAQTLEQLNLIEAGERLFVADVSLEASVDGGLAGCPEEVLSFTCPVRIQSSFGSTTGYIFDPGLQDRLSQLVSGGNARLDLQNLFAETAMIREEVPAQAGRVVQMTIPASFRPKGAIADLLFRGLRDAPWLDTVTPKEGFSRARRGGISLRTLRTRSAVPPLAMAPSSAYFDSIEAAETTIADFSAIQPPSILLQRLNRNMLVSESRLWWRGDFFIEELGRSYASEAQAEASDELERVYIGSTEDINLTSQEAQVRVSIFNDNAYPVRVVIHLRSPDLQLDRRVTESVEPESLKQVFAEVTARASGIFALTVALETPAGDEIDSDTISVRSTEFNKIALGLTFGALAFLILFYVTRGFRRRRPARRESGAEA